MSIITLKKFDSFTDTSAYLNGEVKSFASLMSWQNKINRNWPSNDPCGLTIVTGKIKLKTIFHFYTLLSISKVRTNQKGKGMKSNRNPTFFSFSSKIEWLMQSKAWENHSSTQKQAPTTERSRKLIITSWILIRHDTVFEKGLWANWYFGKQLFRWSRKCSKTWCSTNFAGTINRLMGRSCLIDTKGYLRGYIC